MYKRRVKIYRVPGPGPSAGGEDFISKKNRGARNFFQLEKGGEDFFFRKNKGGEAFFQAYFPKTPA